jgi:fructose transport system permease protein
VTHTEIESAAQMAPPTGPEERRGGFFDRERMAQLGPLFALLLVCIFFTTQSDRFLSGQNFSLIFQQVMVIGTLAIGQTLIILTAGIDLACGAIMAFGGIVMTKLAAEHGLPELSMGTSQDYRVAVEEGATLVRIGSVLFGG